MGRVTINGTQSQCSCKKSFQLDMWDVKGNCAKGRSKEALQINRELDNIKVQVYGRGAQVRQLVGQCHDLHVVRRPVVGHRLIIDVFADDLDGFLLGHAVHVVYI